MPDDASGLKFHEIPKAESKYVSQWLDSFIQSANIYVPGSFPGTESTHDTKLLLFKKLKLQRFGPQILTCPLSTGVSYCTSLAVGTDRPSPRGLTLTLILGSLCVHLRGFSTIVLADTCVIVNVIICQVGLALGLYYFMEQSCLHF